MQMDCAGSLVATATIATASRAKTAVLKGLPACQASALTDMSGKPSAIVITRCEGRHPAKIPMTARPNTPCQTTAMKRQSFAIAVSPARMLSGAGILVADAENVPRVCSGYCPRPFIVDIVFIIDIMFAIIGSHALRRSSTSAVSNSAIASFLAVPVAAFIFLTSSSSFPSFAFIRDIMYSMFICG